MTQASILKISKHEYIAYHKVNGKKNHPGIIFLGGFMSDMSGTKASHLHEFCTKNELNFIRFDYFGHGRSYGKFTDYCISDWKNNTLAVIDKLSDGNQILIGSSMGGWLMLLAALERPQKIKGLIGIAAAPDFTEDLIWNALSSQEQETLMSQGLLDLTSEYSEDSYPISKKLIEDGRNNLLLHSKIPINIPVRLIHGSKDKDVPYTVSQKLQQQITSNDVTLKLVKDADHRISSPQDLKLLEKTLEDMVENLQKS